MSDATGHTRALCRCLILAAVLLMPTVALAGAPLPPSPNIDTEPLPPDEPPFLEDQIKGLPPGVELLPDGTMMQNGVVIGYAAIDSAERRKMRRVHQFSDQWIPAFFYLDDYRMFAPYKLRDIAVFEPEGERLTGLATASGSDVLVYSVSSADSSRLVLRYLDEYRLPEEHFIAETNQIGPDHWFGPLSISLNKRWIVVAVFPDRAQHAASGDTGGLAPYDFWLIDATRQVTPRSVLTDTYLLSISWSASGSRAVLEVQCNTAKFRPSHTMLVLDAEAGSLTQLDAPAGPSCWSPSGEALFIQPREDDGQVVVRYHFASQVAEPYAFAPGRGLWSPDFARYALLDESRLQIGDGFGHSRLAAENAGSRSMLGWSNRGELLARRLPDGTLGFSVGSVRTGAYDRIIAACPPAWAEPDPERPGLHKSMVDGMALDTRLSPVTLGSDPLGFRAWAETADGPCFIWSENTEEGTKLRIIRFVTLTVEDMGIDPRGNLQEQMVADLVEAAAETLAHALRRYALDHDGRLPTQVGGSALEGALKPYLHDPHALRSLFVREEVAARVLTPGRSLRDLVASDEASASEKVARLSQGSLVYEIVAVPSSPTSLAETLDESRSLPVDLRAVREGEPAG